MASIRDDRKVVKRVAVTFVIIGGAALLLAAVATMFAFFAVGGSVTSEGGQSIYHEPISMQQATELIDSGDVSRIAIRGSHGNVDKFCYFLLDEDDAPCQWEVVGADVHLFTQEMPTGVPILAEGRSGAVGLTQIQLDELLQLIEAHNRTAPTKIEIVD